jgi:uncharacterized protein (TIGR00255 family)
MDAMSTPLASMTGFGRARGSLSDRLAASVVVRGVNHRYLDVQVRTNVREELPEVEAQVRDAVASPLERGRVTVQLDLEWTASPALRVLVDEDTAIELLERLQRLALPEGVGRSVELRDVLSIPGIVSVSAEQTTLDETELEKLQDVVGRAADAFVAMRRAEGARLADQIRDELGRLVDFLDWFEPQMPDLRQRALDRVRDRITEVLTSDEAPDPDRLLQEAAVQADRAEVAEEVVRLRAHLAAFRTRLDAGGVVGRPLDFLCQEIHRELNTLGSKCREPEVAERLVDAKAFAERIREQVQNLE